MIYDKINAERLLARKQGRTLDASVLGTLLGEIQRKEASILDGRKVYKDDAVVAVIKKMISNLRELEANGKAVTDEIAVLDQFMPRMMDEEELRMEAAKHASMPEFMKWLKANRSGQYDGRYASAIANEVFAR